MQLQERNLSLGMQGEDVLLLKIELSLLKNELSPQSSLLLTHRPASTRVQSSPDMFDPATEQTVRDFQQRSNIPTTGIVDEETAGLINTAIDAGDRFAVYGVVRRQDGTLASGYLAIALDRDLPSLEDSREGGPTKLGKAVTNAQGFYIIPYRQSEFSDAEADTADLQIVVSETAQRDGNGEDKSVNSEIFYNALRFQRIDIELPAEQQPTKPRVEQPECRRYLDKIEPFLGNIQLHELTDEDINFLNGETRITVEHLKFLKLDAEYGRQYLRANTLDSFLFYGLFRQGLPTGLRRLLKEKPSRWRMALETSIAENIVPKTLTDKLNLMITALHRVALRISFKPGENGDEPGLGEKMLTAPVAVRKRIRFINFALKLEDDENLWEKLRVEENFEEKELEVLRFTVESSFLLGDHLPTLRAIQEMKSDRDWSKANDLATLTHGDILDITTQTVVDDPPKGFEDNESFAKAISSNIEIAFPTAVIAHKIKSSQFPNGNNLVRFFDNNPEFEFEKSTVKQYLSVNPGALEGANDPEALVAQLQGLQRVFRLAPEVERFETVRALIDDGLDSAQLISSKGEETFISDYAARIGGEARARFITAPSGSRR